MKLVTQRAAQHMWKDCKRSQHSLELFNESTLTNILDHNNKGFVMLNRFKREKDLSKN